MLKGVTNNRLNAIIYPYMAITNLCIVYLTLANKYRDWLFIVYSHLIRFIPVLPVYDI